MNRVPQAHEVSEETRRVNPHLFGPMTPPKAPEAAQRGAKERAVCECADPTYFPSLSGHDCGKCGRPIKADGPEKKAKHAGKKRREMNRTEASFMAMMRARLAREHPYARMVYEGLTLRWADETEELRYTPDVVIYSDQMGSPSPDIPPLVGITLVEVKGAYCWRQDLVKWKAAKIAHPQFLFQFWEQVDGEWRQSR
jgi:hypothetical protein